MTARRFGSTYSPKAGSGSEGEGTRPPRPSPGIPQPPPAKPAARRRDWRQRALYVLPTPLLFSTIWHITRSEPVGALMAIGAYAMLFGGAWLLGQGQRAEAAYDARAVARRPAVPRKILAAGLAGIGVATCHVAGSPDEPAVAIGMGVLALGTHLVAFGIDPLKNKGIELGDYESGRVAEALDRAEGLLAEIDGHARTMRDREIEGRIGRLTEAVRAMLARVEKDPRDLSRARRYLSVYLVSAHEATRKYAEAHDKISDPELRDDYISLLSELEASFARGHDMLLEDDRTDLEVEIEVLRERLGQETVHH